MVAVRYQCAHLRCVCRAVGFAIFCKRSRTPIEIPWTTSRAACLLDGNCIEEKVDVHARQLLGVSKGFIIHDILTGIIHCNAVNTHVQRWKCCGGSRCFGGSHGGSGEGIRGDGSNNRRLGRSTGIRRNRQSFCRHRRREIDSV